MGENPSWSYVLFFKNEISWILYWEVVLTVCFSPFFHYSLYFIRICYLGFMPMTAVRTFEWNWEIKSYKIYFLHFSNVIKTLSVFLTLQILQGRNKNCIIKWKINESFSAENNTLTFLISPLHISDKTLCLCI